LSIASLNIIAVPADICRHRRKGLIVAFPADWLQFWLQWPLGPGSGAACLFWFTIETHPIPLSFSPAILNADASFYFAQALGNVVFSESGFLELQTCWGWYQWDGSLVQSTPSVFQFWTPADVLPQSQCAVIQRLTDTMDRSGRGRIYLPGVAKIATDGGYLNSAALVPYQDAADMLSLPLVSQSCIFLPALVSWVNGTLTPITRHVITPRLGVIRKRTNPRASHIGAGDLKPPPP
jgi:hypothetical protein